MHKSIAVITVATCNPIHVPILYYQRGFKRNEKWNEQTHFCAIELNLLRVGCVVAFDDGAGDVTHERGLSRRLEHGPAAPRGRRRRDAAALYILIALLVVTSRLSGRGLMVAIT